MGELRGVAEGVEADEVFDPEDVGEFGAAAVAAHELPRPLEQLGYGHVPRDAWCESVTVCGRARPRGRRSICRGAGGRRMWGAAGRVPVQI
jgi:hypothetical protein